MCLSCPIDDINLDDDFLVDGIQVERSSIKVLDEKGNQQQFSLGTSANGGTRITFTRNRFSTYNIEVAVQNQSLSNANVATFSLKSMGGR